MNLYHAEKHTKLACSSSEHLVVGGGGRKSAKGSSSCCSILDNPFNSGEGVASGSFAITELTDCVSLSGLGAASASETA